MTNKCYLCPPDAPRTELRPYGPRGQWVCYDCAMKPENKAATEAAMEVAMRAAYEASDIVTIGTEDGFVPYKPGSLQ